MRWLSPWLILAALWCACWPGPSAAAASKPVKQQKKKKTTRAAKKKAVPAAVSPKSPWKTPDFADPTAGDVIDGEDLLIRRAAVDALGKYNGAFVVTDADTGRVLTIVNQKLALDGGYQPCSTIKLVTAIAALNEKLITPENDFRLSRSYRLDLSAAMAHSNNYYFAVLGQRLGFEKVLQYARLLGLGEKAGWNIPGEKPGSLPSSPPKNGGVGMMTSFGEGIRMTPLELAALVGAIANGGNLLYLQYPRNQTEASQIQPRLKRQLDFGEVMANLWEGMRGSLIYGTARRAAAVTTEPLHGKTGTCTDYQRAAHMGWFAAFTEFGSRRLAAVVMLTGAGAVNGPVASGIAGAFFRNLGAAKHLAGRPAETCCPSGSN